MVSIRHRSRSFIADWSMCADDVRLRMSGRLVDPTPGSVEWAAALQRSAGAHLHVDLADVTEMDGRGLGLLADLVRDRRATGGSVSVMYANPRVRRLLDITRLAQAFEARSCACVA
ncbi:MAG: STAS domain-containing protein [Vicinamibacterales bacterium]